jgi:hypothetical protein
MTAICTASATSSAAPATFFARWADMSTWPEWDGAVVWARRDGPFAAGTTGALKPRGGPKVSFVIETLEPDREFTDVSSMPGARLRIRHLVSTDGGATRVDIEVSMEGPLAWIWRRAIGRGVASSTPEGLANLVALAEADEADEAAASAPSADPAGRGGQVDIADGSDRR